MHMFADIFDGQTAVAVVIADVIFDQKQRGAFRDCCIQYLKILIERIAQQCMKLVQRFAVIDLLQRALNRTVCRRADL